MCEDIFITIIQFATNVQLKDLNHIFCPWILFHKLYIYNVFFCVLTSKYMCQFGMSLEKLKLKIKHKIKNIYLHGYFLVHILFYFCTYLLT
jgi:hypothetical protein